ncbi:SGNH/GDSL hydrolase family protein [Alicyclobacillus acidiphilus]|uniref:SGNH/GDSL hydrolase family protein n=1 Tax=Alicyclobacillus acidiphilus TaxID=182455 RepID=UPI000831A1A4|nr:SGNH/GDSL hydrolase family protein [Alicyclobacillus acidiphilus]
MPISRALQTYSLADLDHVKVLGRTTGSLTPLTLFWTASGIELNVDGSELWIEVEADYGQYEPWIAMLNNGALVSRQMLTAGRQWLCVFRGMNPDNVKHVRIVKELQAMSGDPDCLLQIHGVKCDGAFFPVEERPLKIEFIGDSITSGEGAVGAKAESDWIPMWFSAVHSYPEMTANELNAEYRVISQSGWGVLTSWDNNPNANIPDGYEKVCGLLSGTRNQALGALDAYDFTLWQPDVVIVNLGTNDAGAFHNPAWIDPVTGEAYKQRLHEDGTYCEEDLGKFVAAAERFLVKLRACNQHAHIVWAYGMIGIPLMPAIYRAVDRYQQKTGDRRVSVFQLPNTTAETVGARNHPGTLAHQKAASELADYIRTILGV